MLQPQKQQKNKVELKEEKEEPIKPEEPKLKKPLKTHYAPAKFFPGKNTALLFTGSDIFFVPCNVTEFGTIEYRLPDTLKNTKAFKTEFKKDDKRVAEIFRPPVLIEIPFRGILPTWLGRRLAPEYQRFMAYCVNPIHDVTFDPSIDRDEIDDATAQAFKSLLAMKVKTYKVDWVGNLAAGMPEPKTWRDWIWPVMLLIQTVIFLTFFIIIPNWLGITIG